MLTWTKELDVHIESIDIQHRTLIALINELQSAIDEGRPNVMIGSVLSKTIEYARVHFEHEENCLIVSCYERYNEHHCAHNELLKKLRSMERDFHDQVPGVAPKVLELLQRWVMLHIMKADREYSKKLVQAGIQ